MCAAERNDRYVYDSRAIVGIFRALFSALRLIGAIHHVKNDPSVALVLGVIAWKSEFRKALRAK